MTSRGPSLKPISGSPQTGEPEYLLVGVLRRPHGLHGDLVMEIVTDFPERLKPSTEVLVGEARLPHTIAARGSHAHGMLVRFHGIGSVEQAGEFRNQSVFVRTSDRPPLPAGRYYHHELLGLKVIDELSGELGHLEDILQTGANDVLVVVTDSGGELLLPWIPSVVTKVDLAARSIVVHVPAGLVVEPARPRRSSARKNRRAGHN